MQAVVQQSNIPAVTEPTTKTEDTTDRCRENIVIEEQTVVADVSKIVSADVPTTVEAERIEPVETPAKPPLEQQQYDEHFVPFFLISIISFFFLFTDRKNTKHPCTATLGLLKSNWTRGSLADRALK